MNAQEVFNTVVAHLRAQGKQSLSKDGTCAYRGEDGLKCAAGILIEDNEYVPEMEHRTFRALLTQAGASYYCASLAQRFTDPGIKEMIYTLQDVHDKADPKDWELNFEKTAYGWELAYMHPKDSI